MALNVETVTVAPLASVADMLVFPDLEIYSGTEIVPAQLKTPVLEPDSVHLRIDRAALSSMY